MTRIQSETHCPAQDVAIEAVELASKLYEQGNALMI